MRRALLAACLSVVFLSGGAAAQWLNYKTPGVPRTSDGKPKLDAAAPWATDGHPLPAYFGYSVGRWDQDTFVVETAGFNNKTPLDLLGHPHSDQLRIIERFRRRDFGHLDVEMTFDDPKMHTRPFAIRISHTLLAEADIFEMFSENEKDCAHIGSRK